MDLPELYVTAFLGFLLSFIVAVSIALFNMEESIDDKRKRVVEEMKLDKRLKVVSAKRKKRVKFADDVVVKSFDHFEGAKKENEPVKDFGLSDEISEKVEILEGSSSEAEIVKVADQRVQGAKEENKPIRNFGLSDELSEKVGILERNSGEAKDVKVADRCKGQDKESAEVMPCGEEFAGECADTNGVREMKVAEEKGSKVSELLDDVLEREVVKEKSDDTKAVECFGVDGKTEVAGGLEGLVAGEMMKTEVIGGESELELVSNDTIDQKGAEVGDRVAHKAELLDEALDKEALKEKSENAEINLDKLCGVEESKIDVIGDNLKNLLVKGHKKSEGLGGEHELKMVNDDITSPQNEEGRVRIGEQLGKGSEMVEGTIEDEKFDDDDDWEGIERSELEKVFAEAVNYVEYGGKGKDDQLTNLGSNVQMQLYGLHKLAVEGPCHEPQPMALKVSARAKWNSWQRLGSMSPEVAMEHYIKLLSDTDPGWTHLPSAEDDKHGYIETGGLETKLDFLHGIEADFEGNGRKLELNNAVHEDNLARGANSTKEISGGRIIKDD